jgi:hypothetical protein
MTSLPGLRSENISMGAANRAAVDSRQKPCPLCATPLGAETMMLSKWISEPHSLSACCAGVADGHAGDAHNKSPAEKRHRTISLVVIAAAIAALSVQARSQVPSSSQSLSSRDDSAMTEVAAQGELDLNYIRPTQRTMAKNYLFDAVGPYPIVGAGAAAGIHQWTNSPLEWGQGAEGYGKRFSSDFAMAAIATTTRYGLSEAFKEDATYYRCECSGFYPRVRHALVSTLTARRGEDGHLVFSIPALVGPYTGTMAATYGWYPSRYNAKDAFRAGNYSLLVFAGGNIGLEFLYSGPHALIARMHLNNTHGSPIQGSNQ